MLCVYGCSKLWIKNILFSWAQWHTPVIPSTQEVETGESGVPGQPWLCSESEVSLGGTTSCLKIPKTESMATVDSN